MSSAGLLRRLATLCALAATSLTTLSCGGDDPATPTESGEAFVELTGAVASDRAVLFEIPTGAVAVSPARNELRVHARHEAGRFVVAVFGPLAQGPIVRIQLPDDAFVPTFIIREVSDESGTLRQSLAGYGLQVEGVR